MTPEDSLKMTAAAIGKDLKFFHSRTSSVTTSWGVNWDEEFIARDLWQNFFDANRHCLSDVKIAVESQTVTISAPVLTELDRLFYLGSEKGDDDVGKYGEGFKVASVCLLRNHMIEPIILSGNKVVLVRLDGEMVSGTQFRPLVYDFFDSAQPFAGTQLILQGCNQKLVKELKVGLNHFFYDGNPLLGSKLWESHDGYFSIYSTTTSEGYVFYRRLKRGVIPEIPVALIIDKEYARIEKKTKQDRDRNAFGEELMKLFHDVFARSGISNSTAGQRVIVEAARPCWQRGHLLLRNIAESQGWNFCWPAKIAAEVFGSEYFARVPNIDTLKTFRYQDMEKEWQKQGRKPLPHYFKKFGVLNAIDHVKELDIKALEERKRRHERPPTPAEYACINLLHDTLRSLTSSLFTPKSQNQAVYSIAETDLVLGELKQDREYRSRNVFLSAKVFVKDFAEAIAIFLHEHAHIYGSDGSRAFTDALTELCESLVRHRQELDPFEDKWQVVKNDVIQERANNGNNKGVTNTEDMINSLPEGQLRALIKQMPEMALQRALMNMKDKISL